MQADTFVEEVRLCAPPAEKLEGMGLSTVEVARFRESFSCKKRLASNSYSDPLLDLVVNYDTSKLEIGTITFNPEVVESERGWRVGQFEIDPLMINRSSGEVHVEDEAKEGYVIWQCAADGEKFLDALLLAACFLAKCSYDEKLANDQAASHEQAGACTKAAGGSEYLDFYLALLGCE